MAPSIDRGAGFSAAMKESGRLQEAVTTQEFSVEQGQEAMAQLLVKVPDVDAIFAHSDQIAAGAMQVLAERGKSVPDDVAIIGFDDFDAAKAVNPELTTMSQPIDKVASAAAGMMAGFLKDGEYELSKQLFKVPLILRKSA
jgi:DNA-binding LacI/PurR family transcriptional regulator